MQRLCRSFGSVRRTLFRREYSSDAAHYFPVLRSPMLPAGTFQDRVAFVTGGGTGLGRGIAERLSSLGATVVIASRNLEVLKRSAEEISQTTGNKVVPMALDVRNAAQVKEVAGDCVAQCGSLPHMVVNNAAGNFVSPTERLSANAFRNIIDIVLNGTANVTLEFGKRLVEAKQGASFLVILAPYTEHGSGYVVPSATAKAGVEAMTQSLAAEWAKYGMRFNGISPGPIKTKGAFSRLDPSGEFTRALEDTIPVGRMGEVEEHANLATYLLSDYASWINGSTVMFDGGQLPYMAGMFNLLSKVPEEQWDMLESMIRKTKGS